MSRINKTERIGIGVLCAGVVVIVVLALCGVFSPEHGEDNVAYLADQQLQENKQSGPGDESDESDVWKEEPATIRGLSDVILHRYLPSHDNGVDKFFYSKGNQKFYYNSSHSYFVLLPNDMGYLQHGEPQLGGHWNGFYNQDSTLVISSGGLFYDVLLDDHPHWEDSLRNNHLKELNSRGKVKFLSKKPTEIVAKVFIDKNNSENPHADYLLSKWILKKNLENRECDISLDIWYSDSLKHRESEFLNIINKFPNNPFDK